MGNLPCTCVKQTTNEAASELESRHEPHAYQNENGHAIITSQRTITGSQPFIKGRVDVRSNTYVSSNIYFYKGDNSLISL